MLPLSVNRIPVELSGHYPTHSQNQPHTHNAKLISVQKAICMATATATSGNNTQKMPLMSAHRVPQQLVEGILRGWPTITYCSHHSNKLTVYYQFFLHSPLWVCVCPCAQFITVHSPANGKHRLAGEHTNLVARIAWENLVCAPTLGRASSTCHSLNRTELPTKIYGLRWIRGARNWHTENYGCRWWLCVPLSCTHASAAVLACEATENTASPWTVSLKFDAQECFSSSPHMFESDSFGFAPNAFPSTWPQHCPITRSESRV